MGEGSFYEFHLGCYRKFITEFDMTEETNRTAPAKTAERSEWERPEVTRLDAGAAEGALNTGTDNVVFS